MEYLIRTQTIYDVGSIYVCLCYGCFPFGGFKCIRTGDVRRTSPLCLHIRNHLLARDSQRRLYASPGVRHASVCEGFNNINSNNSPVKRKVVPQFAVTHVDGRIRSVCIYTLLHYSIGPISPVGLLAGRGWQRRCFGVFRPSGRWTMVMVFLTHRCSAALIRCA